MKDEDNEQMFVQLYFALLIDISANDSTNFLTNIELSGGACLCISHVILYEVNIREENMFQVKAFGSDGVSVMTGKHTSYRIIIIVFKIPDMII